MWVDTPAGNAFVPEDLRDEMLDPFPDTEFPSYFARREALREAFAASDAPDLLRSLLFQRDCQAFSPRLSGQNSSRLAYVNSPFVAFGAFDSREEFHFADASQYAWTHRSSAPWSKRIVCETHRRLQPGKPWSGKFRERSVWIGKRHGKAPDERSIVLAPAGYVEPKFRQMARFASAARKTHRLAACALIHFQLVSIHPFFDGNGRTARILTPLFLDRYGLLDGVPLFTSEIFLETKREYFRRIASLQLHGESAAWIRFFAYAMSEQLSSHARFVRLIAPIREAAIGVLSEHMSHAAARRFTGEILISPKLTRSRAAAILRRTPAGIDRLFSSLEGRFGFALVADGDDPVFQFRDIYEILAI